MYTYDLNKACALHLQYNKVILNFLEKASIIYPIERFLCCIGFFFVGGGWFFFARKIQSSCQRTFSIVL